MTLGQTLERIEAAWHEHMRIRFPPEARGEEIEGINLVELDSTMAGCITSFMSGRGQLDAKRIEILRHSHSEIAQITPKLDAESQSHFERLEAIAATVLKHVDSGAK